MKVQKWIDTPDLKRNEKFIIDWHYFLKEITARLEAADGENYQKQVDLYILKSFYQKPWEKDRDFYEQFEERLGEAQMCIRDSIRTDILPIQADAVPKVRFSDASLSIQLALHDTDHDRFHLPILAGTLFHIPSCLLPTVY